MVLQRAPQSATIFGFDATTEAEVGFQLVNLSKSQLFFKLKILCPEMKKADSVLLLFFTSCASFRRFWAIFGISTPILGNFPLSLGSYYEAKNAFMLVFRFFFFLCLNFWICLGVCVVHSERKATGCATGKSDSEPKQSTGHIWG